MMLVHTSKIYSGRPMAFITAALINQEAIPAIIPKIIAPITGVTRIVPKNFCKNRAAKA
jgi:hypothetical protein